MLALADRSAAPSRATTADFVNDLGKALAGKTVRRENMAPVSMAIRDVLVSTGVPSSRFHGSLDEFREALIALNASPAEAQMAAGKLLILGQEIRGPEDFKRVNIRRAK